jgi:hypothetical protein
MPTSIPTVPSQPAPKKRAYVPAIGPKLKKLLYVLFALLALLGANSLYLATITFLEWESGETYQNHFYMSMFLGHLVLGFVFLIPFLVFGFIHLFTARKRKNKRAIRVGYALFIASLIVLATGLLLVRVGGVFDLKHPAARSIIYWMHVISPIVAVWFYWLHRLVGQKIKWKLGIAYGAVAIASVAIMVSLHVQDPRDWNRVGSAEGVKYFEPSLARTAQGDFIPAKVLDNDEYCLTCHPDAYKSWNHSAHHFSSFNNPAYLASVRETREVSLKRDGNVKASRWCAGCHDPVPFFSGAFDDPHFDDVNHPTSQAGITCTVCHAITNINSTQGNADFTIEEPLHYPFAFSDNPALQWINQQLIKAKPAFHKKTFLKDFHKTSEFCSACHKVHLPFALNQYKDFLRGQNHYDSWLGSGVSGHGARSFYYPEKAQTACASCHMQLEESQDFGAKQFAGPDSKLSIHDHMFASGNTGLPFLRGFYDDVKTKHEKFVEGTMRVDIFGVKEGGKVDSPLKGPIRPDVPTLKRGENYLLETVVRTLKVGHEFTQGTVDSNEVWLEVTLQSGDRTIGKSGGMDADGRVDARSHFMNVFMLDREGNRINRRNPQDIFTPLYNHQIPPGSGQVAHYSFRVPENIDQPIVATVKLQYRKFDHEYMEIVHKRLKAVSDERDVKGTGGEIDKSGLRDDGTYFNNLPVMTLASDSVTFPVEGIDARVVAQESKIPVWQRWNDYGIGLFLEGKAELKQAEFAFQQVEKLKRFDGPLNLARVYLREGRIDEAVEAVQRAAAATDPKVPEWSLAWFSGLTNREQGRLAEAESNFRSIVDEPTEERKKRGFDFSRDVEVLNTLGRTLFDRSEQSRAAGQHQEQEQFMNESIKQFDRVLAIDSENMNAHYNLGLIYSALGNKELEEKHKKLHLRYKPDDNAQGLAVRLAREKYPAANSAAEALVIYPLQLESK